MIRPKKKRLEKNTHFFLLREHHTPKNRTHKKTREIKLKKTAKRNEEEKTHKKIGRILRPIVNFIRGNEGPVKAADDEDHQGYSH